MNIELLNSLTDNPEKSSQVYGVRYYSGANVIFDSLTGGDTRAFMPDVSNSFSTVVDGTLSTLNSAGPFVVGTGIKGSFSDQTGGTRRMDNSDKWSIGHISPCSSTWISTQQSEATRLP